MENGVLAGFPIDSMKIRLFDGSYHDVDSDALSFELCGQDRFKTLLNKHGTRVIRTNYETRCNNS